MKLLALVAYPLDTAPGQRYRIEQWAPYLAEHGVDVTFAPFADPALAQLLYQPGRWVAKAISMARASMARLEDAFAARHFDAVWVHREASLLGPAWAERLAHLRRPRLVYDFDDAVYLPYVSPTNRYLSYFKFPGKTKTLCRLSSVVIAGNPTLGEYARQYNGNVHVVPSTISLRSYRPRPHVRHDGLPVVGWTGSHSSAQYLRLLAGPLEELARRRPFRFLAIGAPQFSVPGVAVECRPWNARTEVEDLWGMDVGVMPLTDDPWAQGKCGMKALQYMGVGIPAVVSPVGVNREIVEHGRNGLHAATAEDWIGGLGALISDPGLRLRLGQQARRSVEERFSAEVHAPQVAALIKSIVP